jgi:hypothetical protein
MFLISLFLFVSTNIFGQSKFEPVSYVTPERDTMYVVESMYGTMVSLWSQPEYAKERPIIISVKNNEEIKSLLFIRNEYWEKNYIDVKK